MDKQCRVCGQTKDLSEFNRLMRSKDGHASQCRDCAKAAYRANRERHLELTTARHLRVAEENKMLYCQYLMENPCADCGETNILVLEPDHLRDKRYNISELVLRAYAWTTVMEELAKCEIVCRNCHSIREARRQDNNYKLRFLGRLVLEEVVAA